MTDLSSVEKIKKEISDLRTRRGKLEIEIAKKEAIINDAKDKLLSEFKISGVDEGRAAVQEMSEKAESLKQDIESLITQAKAILATVNG